MKDILGLPTDNGGGCLSTLATLLAVVGMLAVLAACVALPLWWR